ncbi:Mu-like prophage major head subunit gpT family protein [Candidatus Avelusimicrobium fimicolum]|uniref:Mu-like prophage major head subunit gpT family protein n=1 Tax=Candidatus Avelusimicrobium fimicolum TaxID=3416216 RepID=UPI003D107C96
MLRSLKQLVEEFNQIVKVGFGKQYDEYAPKLHALVGSFKVPYSAATKAVFGLFMDGLKKVVSTPIPSETLPDAYKIVVPHEPFAKRIEIPEAEFQRSQTVADLSLYQTQVKALATLAKDHPVEMAFDMIEAGASSTYGQCFDGENLFSTSHSYGEAASQSNLLTGTGVTEAAIAADLRSATTALEGFFYKSGNRYKRFNKAVKPLVICDISKKAIFEDLLRKETISGTTNTLRGSFELIAEKLNSANSWYIIDQDNGGVEVNAPIINPIEQAAELTNNIGQESQVMDKVLKYQVDYRGGFGYGAWWKIVKVANS